MYLAGEKDINRTLSDFALFCSYLEEKKPTLTRARRELGKKECFELNAMLSRPRQLDDPKYLQPVYLTINLYFHVALETGLFRIVPTSKGRIRLEPDSRLERFRQLNPFSQYMFLFRVYWTWLDYRKLYYDTGAMSDHFIYQRIGLSTLKESIPGNRIFVDLEDGSNYEVHNPLHHFFVCAGPIIHHLQDFGFWECEEALLKTRAPRRNDPNVKSLTPTDFGLAMIEACLKRPYEIYHRRPDTYLLKGIEQDPHRHELFSQLGFEPAIASEQPEPFEQAFVPLFPPHSIEAQAIDSLLQYRINKVEKGGNAWCFSVAYPGADPVLFIASTAHTLYQLHKSIQNAFGLSDDHLHAFFMDDKAWSSEAFWSPRNETGPFTDTAYIASLGLKKNQRFLYLYDFGKDMKFEVFLESFFLTDLPLLEPEIINIEESHDGEDSPEGKTELEIIEELDKLMQAGYQNEEEGNTPNACHHWSRAWALCKFLSEEQNLHSLKEFDHRYHLTQLVSNWIQDYEMALANAAIEDKSYYAQRAQMILDFFTCFTEGINDLTEHNFRRAMAESIFATGERELAENIFRDWLGKEPRWSWGWINWADCWSMLADGSPEDLLRAEDILRQALVHAAEADKEDVYQRLADLYTDMDDRPKAEQTMKELQQWRIRKKVQPVPASNVHPLSQTKHAAPVRTVKIGRNEPCPCGSGKKYKKCCGKNL